MIINWKNVQKSLLLLFLFSVLSFSITSCGDDKKDDDKPVLVEDGTYIVGNAFEYDKLDIKGAMAIGINENGQQARDGMYEKYVALSANGGFNIVVKEGKNEKTYGPDAVVDVDLTGVGDAPQVTIKKGTFKETSDKFTVPADGMYKVVLDNQTGVVAIIPIKNWGVIGGATQGGWGKDQVLPLTSDFSKTALTYEAKEVILIPGEFKFRHDGGWKVALTDDGEVKTNTNFGNALNDLVPGGANLKVEEGGNGYYTITLAWTLDKGFEAKLVKTGDYTPAAYPEAMYIVGDATAYGWDTPGTVENAVMHKCAGGSPTEGLFWKICHIEGGKGFKVSNENWGSFNYGFGEVTEFDAEGLSVSDSGGNMSVENSGMYIVVLDLRDNQVKLSVKAAEVYGIGDAFGGWDQDVAANLFTVNSDKTIVSPALSGNGNIRMYAQHNWIPDWWQAEFRVADGAIDYRNDGGDQEAVAGTAGQVVTLKFDDNTGSVE